MKKVLSVFTSLMLLAVFAFAQAPQGFNYQAVARDNAGLAMPNKTLGIEIIITDGNGGVWLYLERHTATTNQFGLFTLTIGSGTPVVGTFAAISWSTINAWMQVGMDTTGGTTYTNMGTSQLLSVPYALNSLNPGTQYTQGPGISITGTTISVDAQTGPTLTGNGTTGTPLGLAGQGAGTGQVLKYNGSQWVPQNDSVGTGTTYTPGSGIDITGATISNNAQTNTTLTGNGTTGTPLGIASQGAGTGQVLKYNGTQWAPQNDSVNVYTSGSGISVTGTTVNNNAQTNSTLTGNGTTGNPLGLANQGAGTGQVLKYNGSQWVPQNDSVGQPTIYTQGPGIDITGTTVSNNAQTNTTLTGNGTTVSPLGLAPQGAVTGQVLKYDGIQWVPQNDSLNTGTIYTTGSGIDVTGTVVSLDAQTNTTLTGNGTAGTPLGIASQGANTGQVLKYNGTQWVPQNDSVNIYTSGSGINVTGTTVNNNAQTNATLTGNGTTGSPLGLANQGAGTGQVLKYNGAQWVPENDSVGQQTIYTQGSGIDITGTTVSNNAQTNTTLTGNGTTGTPLGLAAQGAVTGQVLKYDGSQWVPQNDSVNTGTVYTPGSGIDVTGTVVSINAQTNTSLTGNGTAGSPLGIAPQGAGIGQVLKYNGTQWVPRNDTLNIYTSGSGISVVGTAVNNNAQTNTTLTGNGTVANPLGIAAQGAGIGQVLKYDGSKWVPQDDSVNTGTIYTTGSGIDVTGTVVSLDAQTNTTLTGNGTAGTPLGIASQGANTGQVLKYNGTQWVPGNDTLNVYTSGSGINVTGTTVSNNALTNTTLTGNGTAGTPLGIASQGATSGQVLKYNGTQWVPRNDTLNIYTSGSGISVVGTTVNNNAQTNTTLTGNGTVASPLGIAPQGAGIGQVLKYDGSKWVPQNDSVNTGTVYTPGSGIDVTGTVVSINAQTNTTLTGNGTAGNPLGLAAQGATSGKVLKYNGTQWVPANDTLNTYTSGSGISVVGTTVNNNAQTNTTLTGNGTTGTPLGLASQGAVSGQVLKYNGSQWVPKNDTLNVYTSGSGITVTGTTVNNNAQTNTTLTGNGTTGTPLGLATQGAASGQVLKYNGSQWVPQNDSVGAGTIYTPGSGIDITGTTVSNNAQTNTTLTGNGTTGTPLGLAAQGATSGQVLKYNGVQWIPANDSVSAGGTTYTAGSGIDITGTTVSNNAQTDTTLTGNGTAGSPLSISAQGAGTGQVLKYNGTRWAPANDSLGGDVTGTIGYIGEFYSTHGITNSPLFESGGRIGLYGASTPDGLFSVFNDGTVADVPTLYINQRDRTGNSVYFQKNSPTSVDANLYLTYNSDALGATIESHATGIGVAGYFSGENLGLAISATSNAPVTTSLFNNGGNGNAINATAGDGNAIVAHSVNGTAIDATSNNGSAIVATASNATAAVIINQNGLGNALELNAHIKIADGTQRRNKSLTCDDDGVGTWGNGPSFIVTNQSSIASLFSNSFANQSGGFVNLTVLDSGTVLVESMVYIQLDHTTGTDDKVALVVGSTPTDSGSLFEQTWWSIPSGYPTFGLTPYSLNVRRTFTVAPGTYTYYINGAMISGLNGDTFNYCNITATFFPQ